MPVTVVVGGQFGSEGKGKVAFQFARQENAQYVVRVGGTNAGHTVIDPRDGRRRIFRHLPTASLLPGTTAVLPPGSYISVDVLEEEIAYASLDSSRLAIDPRAVIIDSRHVEEERGNSHLGSIASTLSGTGAAVRARVMRDSRTSFAKDSQLLRPFLRETTPLLRNALDKGVRVLIEGTQGFGLSLLHSSYFPYVTSRDTTAAGFVSEAGLSPLDVDQVVMTLRAFPIRVAGNSGPLSNETTWDDISRASRSPRPLVEHTSVTKKIRRVGKFDPALVRAALLHERPTAVVLNHVDYFDATCANADTVSSDTLDLVARIEEAINRTIDYIGVGPARILDRRSLEDRTSPKAA